eukprot:TRINITY_DN3074_c0_g3_i1.p1 TRINITY_DN3074_c0_g3~~TRINITY_DN3074_c0_g3_i1.p1  ORF type:complete len:235 (-),score=28.64 TRINITY_DN3074_c0_g3_i1:15-689(-)
MNRQTSYDIAGNYYPTIYASFINDTNARLSVICERSHGVSSLLDGHLEVMLHRNPDMSDGFGPGLTDTTRVYPSLRFLVENPRLESTQNLKKHSYLINFPVVVFSATIPSTISDWVASYETTNSFLLDSLPPNIHFLSLIALDPITKSTAFRLTHLFDVNEDPILSQPVLIDLSKLFVLEGVTISKITETTLTANSVLGIINNPVIQINPKDIRSFVIEFLQLF